MDKAWKGSRSPAYRNDPHMTSPPSADGAAVTGICGQAMLTSQASVPTERASEYLIRLCLHLQEIKGKAGHPAMSRHRVSGAGSRPEINLEWSETRAIARIGPSRCMLQVKPGGLALRAEAPTEEALRQVQALVGGRLEKFGHREQVKVTWQQATTVRQAVTPAPEGKPQQ